MGAESTLRGKGKDNIFVMKKSTKLQRRLHAQFSFSINNQKHTFIFLKFTNFRPKVFFTKMILKTLFFLFTIFSTLIYIFLNYLNHFYFIFSNSNRFFYLFYKGFYFFF